MSLPSIVSYGAAAKTSTLVWDSDLVIPDGYAIESASGEVGIVGDVSISGSLNTEGAFTANDTIQGDVQVSSPLLTTPNITLAGHALNVITQPVSSKPIVVGDNTIALVSSQDAKITGTATFHSNNSGTTNFTLSFSATDALGATKNIKTYNPKIKGGGTSTTNIDVIVPAGTTKIQVAWEASNSAGTLQSSDMLMSAYTTSLVF